MVTTSLRKRNKAWPLLTFLKLFTKKTLWIYLFVPQQIRWNQMSRLSFSLSEWEVLYIFALSLNPSAKCSGQSHLSISNLTMFLYILHTLEKFIFMKNNSDPFTLLHTNSKSQLFYSIQYYHSTLVFMSIEPHERIPTYLSTLIYYYHSSLYSSLHSR